MKIVPGYTEQEARSTQKQQNVTMKGELEKLFQQKKALQNQLVQVQTMLYLIDYYISEELLREVDV